MKLTRFVLLAWTVSIALAPLITTLTDSTSLEGEAIITLDPSKIPQSQGGTGQNPPTTSDGQEQDDGPWTSVDPPPDPGIPNSRGQEPQLTSDSNDSLKSKDNSTTTGTTTAAVGPGRSGKASVGPPNRLHLVLLDRLLRVTRLHRGAAVVVVVTAHRRTSGRGLLLLLERPMDRATGPSQGARNRA